MPGYIQRVIQCSSSGKSDAVIRMVKEPPLSEIKAVDSAKPDEKAKTVRPTLSPIYVLMQRDAGTFRGKKGTVENRDPLDTANSSEVSLSPIYVLLEGNKIV